MSYFELTEDIPYLILRSELAAYLFQSYDEILGGCFGIEHPSETQLKQQSCGVPFVHNINFICWIVYELSTEHGNVTAMLYAKLKTIMQLRNWLLADKFSWMKM